MTENKIEMDVLGITYSQIQQGAYALLLKQRDGDMRVPIVVGVSEAQSIAMRLEHVIPPRPMSHDLMVSMFHAFGISLDEVVIYKFSEGVFMSRLKLSSNDTNLELESRTSDAIALALRTSAPIFITAEVLNKTGFLIKDSEQGKKVAVKPKRSLNDMTIEELQKKLSRAVELEKYELAASIQRTINDKLGNEPSSQELNENNI
ncbi:MAG: bifunctional nuclease family protein [Muribaculaceae bacterium]|nr:bifunctional nuclease family protein [Muribaculaceae bacterium]MBQ2563060.1 bifunctional nuclease family protein [Muribaculaceae bacterium]MBQ5408494.1 bifunctional nuclease family protein [Muribaculaceae bacterium]MDY6293990.1 bifunctional nuclease family protein [Bacteroidales bacterium]